MKVTFENGVGSYSGKYDEVVYQAWFKGRLCLARKYAYPILNLHHAEMRAIGENLNTVYLAADPLYVADLKAYASRHAREYIPKAKRLLHPMPTAKSIFVKCMWLWQQSDPEHVDLKSVTIADIVSIAPPVLKVKRCVQAGYLRRVSDWESLDHPIGE